jgi:hypothetical protein
MTSELKDRAWAIYQKVLRGDMLMKAELCGWQLRGPNYINVADSAAVEMMLAAGLLELKVGTPWTLALPKATGGTNECS